MAEGGFCGEELDEGYGYGDEEGDGYAEREEAGYDTQAANAGFQVLG